MGYIPPKLMQYMTEEEYDQWCSCKINIDLIPSHFDWKQFRRIKDKWQVTISLRHIYQKYMFDTEEKANEFVMLKMLEQC